VLSNVSYEDEGWYTCIAGNSLGLAYASAYLHVVDSKLSYFVVFQCKWTVVSLVFALIIFQFLSLIYLHVCH